MLKSKAALWIILGLGIIAIFYFLSKKAAAETKKEVVEGLIPTVKKAASDLLKSLGLGGGISATAKGAAGVGASGSAALGSAGYGVGAAPAGGIFAGASAATIGFVVTFMVIWTTFAIKKIFGKEGSFTYRGVTYSSPDEWVKAMEAAGVTIRTTVSSQSLRGPR